LPSATLACAFLRAQALQQCQLHVGADHALGSAPASWRGRALRGRRLRAALRLRARGRGRGVAIWPDPVAGSSDLAACPPFRVPETRRRLAAAHCGLRRGAAARQRLGDALLQLQLLLVLRLPPLLRLRRLVGGSRRCAPLRAASLDSLRAVGRAIVESSVHTACALAGLGAVAYSVLTALHTLILLPLPLRSAALRVVRLLGLPLLRSSSEHLRLPLRRGSECDALRLRRCSSRALRPAQTPRARENGIRGVGQLPLPGGRRPAACRALSSRKRRITHRNSRSARTWKASALHE